MHPELIKAEMRMKGVTPAALADSMGITRPSVSSVINGQQKSMRVMKAVAALIGKPFEVVWPPKKVSGMRRSKKAVAA
jgi:lambda repressor-like predicted transcriptional regulator